MRNARERRECNTESKDEMMDERYPAVCFKKGFFSPSFSLSLVFEVTIPFSVQLVVRPEKESPPHTSATLSRLLVPHGKQGGRKGSRKDAL